MGFQEPLGRASFAFGRSSSASTLGAQKLGPAHRRSVTLQGRGRQKAIAYMPLATGNRTFCNEIISPLWPQ